jgi:hypothetical protein
MSVAENGSFSCRLAPMNERNTRACESPSAAMNELREGASLLLRRHSPPEPLLRKSPNLKASAQSRVPRGKLSGVPANHRRRFVNAGRDAMHLMLCRCLRAIEHAMSARREYMTKDGTVIQAGPGFFIRLEEKRAAPRQQSFCLHHRSRRHARSTSLAAH